MTLAVARVPWWPKLAWMAVLAVPLLCPGADGWGSPLVKTDALPADTLIVLQRGACEHRCAVYNVVIFADGSALFDGRHYVRRVEPVKTRVSRADLGALMEAAAALRFFDLNDRYVPGSGGCASAAADAPTAIVSVSSGGRSKTVVHHHACAGSEAEGLKRFEDAIDRLVQTGRWVK